MPVSTRNIDAIALLLSELRRQGITDERVLTAIYRVPRERFLPSEQQLNAWKNVALPIGAGQTISQPFIVALMTQALELSGGERVLEIGTGSGYQSAILVELGARVWSIERHRELARRARHIVDQLGFREVRIRVGDGSAGWPAEAPFDRIIVTAGSPAVPLPLLTQLSPDHGRLVIPVGDLDDQRLIAIEKQGNILTERPLGPVRFVPLLGAEGWHESPPAG